MADVFSRTGRWVGWILILLMLSISLLLILQPAPQPTPAQVMPRPPSVPVVALQTGDMRIAIHSQGHISMAREQQLSSEVQGHIIWINDRWISGETVLQGEALLRIDAKSYQLEVSHRQADLDRRLLQQAEVRALAATRRHQATDNEFAQHIPQLRMAQSQVDTAYAALQFAQQQLYATTITAPIDGRVASALAQPGQFITPSMVLGVIHDDAWQEIHLSISDQEAQLLGVNDALPDEPLAVQLRLVNSATILSGAVIRRSAQRSAFQQVTLTVRPIYQPGQTPLLAGTFVTADILSPPIRGLGAIPHRALQTQNRLFHVDAEQRIVSQAIDVVYRGKERVYFRYPDNHLTYVINSSRHALTPGMAVTPITTSHTTTQHVANTDHE